MTKRKALSYMELEALANESDDSDCDINMSEMECDSNSDDSETEQLEEEVFDFNNPDEVVHPVNLEPWRVWGDMEPRFREFPFTENVGYQPPRGNKPNTELDFFKLFFTDELLQAIVDETNR